MDASETIRQPDALLHLKRNCFEGALPQMANSQIILRGSGNILYCEDGVRLQDSRIQFFGSDSVIYLSKSMHPACLHADLYQNCTLYLGQNYYMNGYFTVFLSEQSVFFAGSDSIFSSGITVRTADPHLIYDVHTRKRRNPTKSIFLGDHVWVGQDVLLLKGTQIASGSIIGGNSVVPGKRIGHNTCWAGNPAREIGRELFWEGSCVHGWTSAQTEAAENFTDYAPSRGVTADEWIYAHDEAEYLPFDTLETRLHHDRSPQERLGCLQELVRTKTKNRFAF